ncbi:MAG: class II fumarate hydratase [Promicromonosporaceae bacterium]|nr:class II fumarate hydratase [Promicromonosporaceae bacterium]
MTTPSPERLTDTPLSNAGFRVTHDSMGEVLVPESALYGAQTQRAVENFPISGLPLPDSLLVALAQVKQACAEVNAELGVIPGKISAAISAAATEVAARLSAGEMRDQFPIDFYQTGSGTSSNMNMNEVLATLASRALTGPGRGVIVHPNDHVNASQSTNDVFPTAIHIGAARELVSELVPALGMLAESLTVKGDEFREVVKAGRTHLMDATPVTLGQEFSGYSAAVVASQRALERMLDEVCVVPLGGTAVGTGINTPPGFSARVISRLAEITGLPVTEASNHMFAQWSQSSLVAISGALRVLAVTLTKICNDLRWMGSGPNAGLAEINLPDLQPGSSIMPGKVNPVIPEAVLQVCSRVVGNDATVAWAGASGNFELNVQMPVLAAALLESITLLANAARLLAVKCVAGITANVERCYQLAAGSPAIVTALNPIIGYERAAEIAKYAVTHGVSVRGAVLALGLVDSGVITVAQLDAKLDLFAMTGAEN